MVVEGCRNCRTFASSFGLVGETMLSIANLGVSKWDTFLEFVSGTKRKLECWAPYFEKNLSFSSSSKRKPEPSTCRSNMISQASCRLARWASFADPQSWHGKGALFASKDKFSASEPKGVLHFETETRANLGPQSPILLFAPTVLPKSRNSGNALRFPSKRGPDIRWAIRFAGIGLWGWMLQNDCAFYEARPQPSILPS